MNEEITASAPLDVSTYLLAFKWARHRKSWVRKLVYGVVVFGAMTAAWLGISDGTVEVQDVLPSLLGLGFLGIIIRRSRDVTDLSQRIQQMPGYGELFTWIINENGYEVKVGEVDELVPWAGVFETVSTPDGMLIYIQKDAFEWLPKTAFASDADYLRFREFASAKTKHSQIA